MRAFCLTKRDNFSFFRKILFKLYVLFFLGIAGAERFLSLVDYQSVISVLALVYHGGAVAFRIGEGKE